MKSITPICATPGTIKTDDCLLRFTMDSNEADKFSLCDPVLITGFSSYGFRDGMALYARSVDIEFRKVLVVFERRV